MMKMTDLIRAGFVQEQLFRISWICMALQTLLTVPDMLFALVVFSLSLLLVLVLVFVTLKAWLRFFGPKPVTSSHLQPSASRVRVLSWNANQNPDWNCNAG
jgi:hypothetical protein